MLQRNDQDRALAVHTDPPQVLQPGAVIDHDMYVVGLTVLEDPPSPVVIVGGLVPDPQPTQAKTEKTPKGNVQ